MFIRLLLLFTLVPVLEIYVLLQVGSVIGVIPTVLLILATGMAGAYLARSQGFQILTKIQNELQTGHLPTQELLDGAIILVGGVLLLTPGFCTDLAGIVMLIPGTRNWLKKVVGNWLQTQLANGKIVVIKR